MKMSFARFFGKRSEDTSGARRRIRARPSLEGLEERVALSNTWVGNYTNPGAYYAAGTQRVVYWAEDVGGSFTASNAQAAWSQAMGLEATTHGTLSSTAGVPPDRTASNHFLLIGWENLDTHTGGFVAARFNHTSSQLVKSGPWYKPTWNTVTHTTMDWMSNGNPGRSNVEGPLTLNFSTNRYTVGLYISPDSSGYVHGSFTAPHLQPPPGV